MEQTAEFQSFRMRTFEVKGNGHCLWKGNSFMALKLLNVIVQRFRSKAFSPACLFRFSESSTPSPNCDTVSRGRVEVYSSDFYEGGRILISIGPTRISSLFISSPWGRM